MKQSKPCSLLLAILLLAPLAQSAIRPKLTKLYHASVAAFVAGNVADIHSSLGGYETNPLARSSDGQFSPAKGIALKSGIVAGTLILQRVLIRRYPTSQKGLAIVNFGCAGAMGVVARHNYTMKEQSK